MPHSSQPMQGLGLKVDSRIFQALLVDPTSVSLCQALLLRTFQQTWTPVRPSSNHTLFWNFTAQWHKEGSKCRLKLKLQYRGHLMWRADSLEKTLMLGMIEGRRRRGWQRMRRLDSITNSMDMSLSQLWERVKEREAWRAAGHGVAKSPTRQQPNSNKRPLRGETGHLQKHESQHGIRLLKNINGRRKQRNTFKPQRKS